MGSYSITKQEKGNYESHQVQVRCKSVSKSGASPPQPRDFFTGSPNPISNAFQPRLELNLNQLEVRKAGLPPLLLSKLHLARRFSSSFFFRQ